MKENQNIKRQRKSTQLKVPARITDLDFIAYKLEELQLGTDFSKKAKQEAQGLPNTLPEAELKRRTDLRGLPFVTIDGEDAKDFDDAVYVQADPEGGFTLYVAIADVSYYVAPKSQLDKEAYKRGTSIYFPKFCLPMLPPQLSENLCSLKPNEDRLVMVMKAKIRDEKILESSIFEGVIKSTARLTYNEVQRYFEGGEQNFAEKVKNNLKQCFLLYKELLAARNKRHALDFDIPMLKFEWKEDGSLDKLQNVFRQDSHRLIEEFMLLANVVVAQALLRKKTGIFRVHGKPTEEKFSQLKGYLNTLAITWQTTWDKLQPSDYVKLVEQIKTRDNFHYLEHILLRSMQLAVYQPHNSGHFGLNYQTYTHFTSPIRRYPDLMVHRMIKGIAIKQDLQVATEHLSFREKQADDLSRDVASFYKCQYAARFIGQEFEGFISSVTSFGIFVHLNELMVEGLVHISGLGDDIFTFDAQSGALIGRYAGKTFKLGDKVKVLLENVSLEKLFIDLSLISAKK